MDQSDPTSTKVLSSTVSKAAHMATTDKSKRRKLSGGLIGETHELSSESALWRAVIAQSIRDIYRAEKVGGEMTLPYRMEVVEWINSPDYEVVCHLAFVDPVFMKEQIENLLAMPRRLAMKYAIPLCDRLTGEGALEMALRRPEWEIEKLSD